MTDTGDFTGSYNTPLTPEQEQQFQAWARKNNRLKDLYDYDMRGAWLSGAKQASNGHFTDQFKKPNHPTFSTESQYSGKDGFVGGSWEKIGNKWNYTASPTNLKFHAPSQLNQYFKGVEPDSTLILAPTNPTK